MELFALVPVAQAEMFYGQGWQQIGALLLAFVLSSVIGLEREWRDKSAGLRIYSSVGTSAALLTLLSKYGFTDVVVTGLTEADPSRLAAQIVTGVGFLGAGLILTRHGTVSGLTTAATMWGTAAIGIAAGAGLWLLALAATVLPVVSALVYDALSEKINPNQSNP